MRHTITIIGGGASGTLLCVQLLRQATQPLSIYLVEQNGPPGRGVAYGTTSAAHRLNVPANKMGAYPDQPGHFYDWLQANQHAYAPDAFVPRRLYAQYLRTQLDEAMAAHPGSLEIIHDQAVDLHAETDQLHVHLASGRKLTSQQAVLAFGNFLPAQPRFLSPQAATAARYFGNPWQPELARHIRPGDRVLVIGMGLTAVDTLLSLQEHSHHGALYAISTHGWWPAVHQLGHSYPDFSGELAGLTTLRSILPVVRKHLRQAQQQGSNWRAVIDALRAATPALWQQLPLTEKQRFMRHMRRLWDVSRHRMPQECASALEAMHASGQLQSLQGRISEIGLVDGQFQVLYQQRTAIEQLSVDAVINCMGSDTHLARLDSPLLKQLLARQLIQADALGQGIEAAPNGIISERLYTLGPALKGVLWESTAMPEIRTQAQQLAARLLSI